MPSANISCRLKKLRADGAISKHYVAVEGGSCCGVSEITWQEAIDQLLRSKTGDSWQYHPDQMRRAANKVTDSEVRALIRNAISQIIDERMVHTGIPSDLHKDRHSDYWAYMPVYAKLIALLPEFGFKQVGKPYINKNSGNKIVVFIGKNGA